MIYENIETLPYGCWRKINETNELKYLVKEGKYDKEKLKEIWNKIYREFLNTFGVPVKMQKVFKLKREILLAETKMAVEGRKDLEALIKLKKSELEGMTAETNKERLNLVAAFVSKEMGFRIEEDKISVKEFYTYLNYIEKLKKEERSAIEAAKRNGKK